MLSVQMKVWGRARRLDGGFPAWRSTRYVSEGWSGGAAARFPNEPSGGTAVRNRQLSVCLLNADSLGRPL